MITITEAACAKITTILDEETKPGVGVQAPSRPSLRVFVQGGGCSGFQYGFTLDSVQGEDDTVISFSGGRIFVDAMSLQYLDGANIDYKEELLGARFVLDNPNVKATCGCGSSFTTD